MKRVIATCLTFLSLAGAAAACPDFNQSGDTYQGTGKQLFQERQFPVRAGGNNNIQNCRNVTPGTDRGRGYVTTAPDFTFSLSGMGAYQLVVSVVSECDSVLLVNTSSANWYYDDDDNGNLDAKIVLTRPSDGWLDVWVGTENGAVCDAILSMETFKR